MYRGAVRLVAHADGHLEKHTPARDHHDAYLFGTHSSDGGDGGDKGSGVGVVRDIARGGELDEDSRRWRRRAGQR